MEVVAAISSIAGILSLLGQAIDNTQQLRGFLSDMSSASEIIGRFLHDINELLQTLDAVNHIVESLPSSFYGPHIAFLQAQLEDYTRDVFVWFKTARSLRPASTTGAKVWFKRSLVAASDRSVRDMREELCRHNQAIGLSLSVLGRTLDISTAKELNSIGGQIDHGTAASLSRIEEQNTVLERIQTYSETTFQTSAASVRSLHSIATSLSRIESLASSAGRTTVSQQAYETGSPRLKSRNGTKRLDSGYYSMARKSGSSFASKRVSSARTKSSPAVARFSDAKLSLLPDEHISEASWESQSEDDTPAETRDQWSDVLRGIEGIDSSAATSSENLSGLPDQHLQTDHSLHEQYQSLHHLTRRLTAAIYPPVVVEYISLIQIIKDYENKISILNLLKFGCNIGEEVATTLPEVPADSDLCVLQHERNALQNRLRTLHSEVQKLRKRCIAEGHALWDIDQRFGRHVNTVLPKGEDQDPNTNLIRAPRQLPSEILESENQRTDSRLLGKWTSNRDRVNRWLMHCLQTDQSQAALHKSMLAEAPPDDTNWARQVLKHWYTDEAATGGELQLSLSVGAVDSHTADEPRCIVEVPGVLSHEGEHGFNFF